MNKLLRYSKSENDDIKEVANDLRILMSDLTKMNYEYLDFITNTKYNEKELKKKSQSLIEQNKFVSGFFRQISLGICTTLVKSQPNKKEDKQYCKLTLNQRNQLNTILTEKFGKSIEKGTKIKSKNAYEYSSRLIYEFINMEWEFEKE